MTSQGPRPDDLAPQPRVPSHVQAQLPRENQRPQMNNEESWIHVPDYHRYNFLPPLAVMGLQPPEALMVHKVLESCPFKMTMAGVGGLGFGFLIGFMFSSLDSAADPSLDPNKLNTRQLVVQSFRNSWERGVSSAKGFAKFGVVIAGFECVIEKHRGTHDIWNPVASGCLAGMAFAHSGGPLVLGGACAGMAAMSAAFHHFMH